MEGVVELAEEVFHSPVRLGFPHGVTGLSDVVRNPIHSTGVGLLRLQQKSQPYSEYVPVGASLKDIWQRMKDWFEGNF